MTQMARQIQARKNQLCLKRASSLSLRLYLSPSLSLFAALCCAPLASAYPATSAAPDTASIAYQGYLIAGALAILLVLVIFFILQNRERRFAETRYRVLIEQAPEAILVVDFDTKFIIDANPSAEKLFRCSRNDLLNSTVRQLYAVQQPDGLPLDETRAANVVRAMAGESVLVERIMRAFDGQELFCELRLVKLPDLHRNLLRVSMVDVTQRKRAEAEVTQLNLRLQAVLNAAQEVAIIASDAAGLTTVFNQGAEKMFGYTAGEILGRSPAMLHIEEEVRVRAAELTTQLGRDIQGFETFVVLTRDGSSDIRNWTYVRKDGSQLQVSLAVSAIRNEDGEISGFLGVALDVSKKLEAESALMQLNQQLDHRVQERTRALRTSTEQLQLALNNLHQTQHQLVQSEKLAALGKIVAAVAHELNTPLGNCLTVASTLHEKTMDFDRKIHAGELRRSSLADYLQDSSTATQLLLRGLERAVELVANFKQVAVDQSSAQRRRFVLKDIIDSVLALMNSSLKKKPYQIQMDIPETLEMDSYPGPIEQLISNLINNSVLHGFDGREHGVIRIVARAEQENICISFSDDGNGMSAEVQSHIFDPFFTTRMGTGGSGLGLSICYNLVLGPLGGSIDVASLPEQGSTFTIVLPRVAPVAKIAHDLQVL